jgi:hypothetical protein
MTTEPRLSRRSVSPFPWEALAQPRIFWLGTVGILIAAGLNFRDPVFEDLLGFVLIVITALLPAFLWCQRITHGIPIFPVFAVGTIWTFAMPLISHHPLVVQYLPVERLTASLTVAVTNLIGTGCWYLFTRRIAPPPRSYRGLRSGSGNFLFFATLAAAIAFNVVTTSFSFDIEPAVFSLVRAVVFALANLGIFVLGYQAGERHLGSGQTPLYIALVVLVMLSSLPSLLMVSALSDGALALMGFALGRGRLPWLALALFLSAAFFLQSGKAAMREKYWSPEDNPPIPVWQYPAFFDDWMGFSSRMLLAANETSVPAPGIGADEPQSFTERASLMHLFLQIQRMSPARVPYLNGATYAVIPRLLVPRFFDPEKERAHLGTYMLAIHYDLQRTEDTYTTTIGFGLINEAMANFGRWGCVGLGAVLGAFFGWAGRWSSSYPLLSLRAFFSILVLTVAFENEFTAGVLVTVLFQGSCALIMLSVLAMRRVPVYPARAADASPEKYPPLPKPAHA